MLTSEDAPMGTARNDPARRWRPRLRAGFWLIGLIPVVASAGPDMIDDEAAWTTPGVDLARYQSVQDRPGQDPELAVVVAISGGGHRASNFAVGVLEGLEAIELELNGSGTNALDEVDYFSTVSGGGFAAGSYVASLAQYIEANGSTEGYVYADAVGDDPRQSPRGVDPDLREHLRRNFEKTIVRGALSPSSLGRGDRGDFFEQGLHRSLLGGHHRRKAQNPTLTLGDVFVRVEQTDRTPTLPYWVCNATAYANGALVPFTPDVIEAYSVVGFTHDRTEVHADDLAGSIGDAMPYARAVKTSASFPGVVPASVLVCGRDAAKPFLHLADGGLADNLGIVTAKSLLAQERAPRKVLIVVDAFVGPLDPYSAEDKAPGVAESAIRALTIGFDARRRRSGTTSTVAGVATVILNLDSLRATDDALWQVVVKAGTRLAIEPYEQDQLIMAGRRIVLEHRDEILRAMAGQ